ncbi:MAG: endo-1,4-beta-xylanase, partial [Pseudomonadota bacterium]
FDRCTESCATGNDFCANQCLARRAAEEHSCGFLPVPLNRGGIALPALAPGQPAHLSALLDDDEIAVVEAADRRSADHRQRSVRLWIDAAETPISITQIEHDFSFGVPLDSREFADGDGRLAFYSEIARPHANLLVAETSLKWRNTEREQGRLTFDLADFELDWAESLGFDIKAHVLLWGNPPPLASGSGTPEWLRNAFPEETLSTAQREELQRLIRARIAVTVERYRGRIDVWEVTNEMLNPLTSWFVDRLGPEVVDDAFRSAKLADPGAQLVYNEWISDIFTGVGGPDAQAVRDRVIELKQAGVPVDALGQQGHFAPALVNIGVDVDLSERTRIDDYADALEVLAEAGLPIHITEVTFAAPDEPELRAAQAEAIMRIWWGHPQVEEIVFWNFWNPLGPRSRLDLGLYDDDGNLSRHGEAILSLLNDRWRTQVDSSTEQNGAIEFRGTLGRYVAQWETTDGPVSAIFEVVAGPDTLDVVVVSAP